MNEIFEKIKALFNKIINKEKLLPEKTEPVECVSNSAINTRVNTQTGLFIENTYEIDMLKHKLESGEKSIDKIPYEKKLELIRSYEKENEMLETEIRMILRTNNNN